MLNFQMNLRRTALGLRFGRDLLTNPDSISPDSIGKVLTAMGFRLPPDVRMTADAAQALITGHAAVSRLGDAQTAEDYRQIISMSSPSVRTLTAIAGNLGMVDSNTATQVSVGLDVALLFASGGADVGAWIRVGLAIGGASAAAEAEAKAIAQQSMFSAYQADIQKNIANFTQSLKDLESGKIGIFGFLVANAQGSQLIFDNVITKNPALAPLVDKIPGLKLLPIGDWVYSGKGSSTTWWGETKTATESFSVKGLGVMPTAKATDFLLHWLIEPSAKAYLYARDFYLRQGKADLFHVASLALFEPKFELKRQMSLLDTLVRVQISPSELGEKNVFQSVVKQNASIVSSFGILKKETVYTKEEMEEMDRAGNILALRNNRLANEQMKQRFDFGPLDVEQNGKFLLFDWRNMANFISMLDFLDLIYSDPSYEAIRANSDTLQNYDLFPKILEFKIRYEEVWKRSMIRRVNTAALSNVAYFLGSSPDKIKTTTRDSSSSIFNVK